MKKYHIADLPELSVLDQDRSIDPGVAEFKLDDGTKVKLPLRHALLHDLVWEPLIRCDIPITKQQLYRDLYPFTGNSLASIQTVQYRQMLDEAKYDNHMELIHMFGETIFHVYAYCYRHLSSYQRSLSYYDLMKLRRAPELQDLLHPKIPADQGTRVAEQELARRTKELTYRLSTPGFVKGNNMEHFMEAGVFKKDQVANLLIAIGMRSDINDMMIPHVMNNSIVEGMGSVCDIFTEMHASKKNTHFNQKVITVTQSFAREMRMATCNLKTMYEGTCGRTDTYPHRIYKGHGHNYIDKMVVFEDKLQPITDKNYKSFEGKEVGMIGPLRCNHIDGVCESCAGRATNHPWRWFPEIAPGPYASSIKFSIVSQNVLSAKHHAITTTLQLILSAIAKDFLVINPNKPEQIKLNKRRFGKMKGKHLHIPIVDVGHLSDLDYSGLTPEGYGLLSEVGFTDLVTDEVEFFEVSENNLKVHLDANLIKYMRENRDLIVVDNKHYRIDLSKFSASSPIFKALEVNDDLPKFARRIKRLYSTEIAGFANIAQALQQIAEITYGKISVNFFMIELIVKAMLNGVMPVGGNISLSKIGQGIAESHIAVKLAHQDIKRFLTDPNISVKERTSSAYDPLFGLN